MCALGGDGQARPYAPWKDKRASMRYRSRGWPSWGAHHGGRGSSLREAAGRETCHQTDPLGSSCELRIHHRWPLPRTSWAARGQGWSISWRSRSGRARDRWLPRVAPELPHEARRVPPRPMRQLPSPLQGVASVERLRGVQPDVGPEGRLTSPTGSVPPGIRASRDKRAADGGTDPTPPDPVGRSRAATSRPCPAFARAA